MIGASLYERAILIDTSAAIALRNRRDRHHATAVRFFEASKGDFVWVVLNASKHETYTRMRYDISHAAAVDVFQFLSGNQNIMTVQFEERDEADAFDMLQRYADQCLSFHDALCAATMKRFGIYRAFSFDADFYVFGFEILPGI